MFRERGIGDSEELLTTESIEGTEKERERERKTGTRGQEIRGDRAISDKEAKSWGESSRLSRLRADLLQPSSTQERFIPMYVQIS
jgi:hypothetical protein